MGRRKDRARTPGLWIAASELPPTDMEGGALRFDEVVEGVRVQDLIQALIEPVPAGRPSLTPATYFRLLLIGYFEGIDSERGIAWRTAARPLP